MSSSRTKSFARLFESLTLRKSGEVVDETGSIETLSDFEDEEGGISRPDKRVQEKNNLFTHLDATPSLLRVPLEVRLLIYDLLFRSEIPLLILRSDARTVNPSTAYYSPCLIKRFSSTLSNTLSESSGLWLVNKQISEEVLHYLYSRNSFILVPGSFPKEWIQGIGEKNQLSLRHLVVLCSPLIGGPWYARSHYKWASSLIELIRLSKKLRHLDHLREIVYEIPDADYYRREYELFPEHRQNDLKAFGEFLIETYQAAPKNDCTKSCHSQGLVSSVIRMKNL